MECFSPFSETATARGSSGNVVFLKTNAKKKEMSQNISTGLWSSSRVSYEIDFRCERWDVVDINFIAIKFWMQCADARTNFEKIYLTRFTFTHKSTATLSMGPKIILR